MAKNRRKNCCCSAQWGTIILILGVLYLLQDLTYIDWWRLSWFTVVFLLLGLKMLFTSKK
ncbi:hypothetical protein CMO92_00650 [Candidatus Woesearchaeota archaeon]|nr:hypothetical protein [Candidatus Woesearchaeota archaeon]